MGPCGDLCSLLPYSLAKEDCSQVSSVNLSVSCLPTECPQWFSLSRRLSTLPSPLLPVKIIFISGCASNITYQVNTQRYTQVLAPCWGPTALVTLTQPSFSLSLSAQLLWLHPKPPNLFEERNFCSQRSFCILPQNLKLTEVPTSACWLDLPPKNHVYSLTSERFALTDMYNSGEEMTAWLVHILQRSFRKEN